MPPRRRMMDTLILKSLLTARNTYFKRTRPSGRPGQTDNQYSFVVENEAFKTARRKKRAPWTAQWFRFVRQGKKHVE